MNRLDRKEIARQVKGNFIEKTLAAFAPSWAARRMKARTFMAITGSYIGGSKIRRQTKQWTTIAGDADSDQLFDVATLRDRSRDMLRNEPLATSAVNTTVTNVIGTGLTLKPSIDADALGLDEAQADELEKQISREWKLWAESKDCDSTRTQNFAGLQDLALRSSLESGDCIATMPFIQRQFNPYKLAVQLIEADRLSNQNNIANTKTLTAGVEKDVNGAPIGYWISNFHPGSMKVPVEKRKWTRFDAFGKKSGRQNVIHLFVKLRPGQTRGMPLLAPVIEPLKMLGKYTEAELMAAVIGGMFTVFVKTEGGQGVDVEADLGAETGAKAGDKDLKLASGAVVDLVPGESIETANPGRPNTAFDPFVTSILRQIGAALEIPFEILIKHFTASYSASRAALLEAWRFFRKRRAWMAQNFCQPVYENWFDEAVITGRISAPGYFNDPVMRKAYLGAQWNGPGRGMIKEKEEIEAAQKRVDGGFSTLEKETAEIHGGDWPVIHRQRVKEKEMRVAGGLEEPVGAAAAPAALDAPPPPDIEDLEDDR